MKLASAAPVTPILGRETKVATILRITSNAGHMCPVPKIRNGASTMLSAILSTCKMTVGWTISGCAQGRPKRHQRKLQEQRGKKPNQIRFSPTDRVKHPRRASYNTSRVSTKPKTPSATPLRSRHHEGLIEDDFGPGLILSSGGVRN